MWLLLMGCLKHHSVTEPRCRIEMEIQGMT